MLIFHSFSSTVCITELLITITANIRTFYRYVQFYYLYHHLGYIWSVGIKFIQSAAFMTYLASTNNGPLAMT